MRTTIMTPSTPSTMTRTITTRAICTSEHSSALLVVFLFLIMCHDLLGSSRSCVCHLHAMSHMCGSLWFSPTSFSISTCLSPSSSTLLSWCTLTCTPTSTTWTPWKITCATPPRGASTPTTSPSPSQVMSPTTRSLTSSSTPRVPFPYVTPSSDQDIDDTTLGKLLTEAHRQYADYRSLEGVFVSQSSLSVASDRTGKPVGKSDLDQFSFGVRNAYSAHNQFPAITQAEKMVDRMEKPVGESSSSAQIRTLFDEQRQMIIGECCEKVSHHELQAARAEQDRQILQEELWRQQKDFREVHQQNLTEMEEVRKFQSSTFDTHMKLIEDQNTIMELSGRLQELQNEVNCMDDSKDFQDAESVRSGNSHVTSQPMLFPKHPILEGIVEAFIRIAAPQRRTARHLGYTWYIGKRFCKSTCFFYSSLSSRIESMEEDHWGAASYVYSGEEWKTRTKSRSEMPVWTVSQTFCHLQWRRLFKEVWGRPTTTADFWSPFWQVSLRQPRSLAGRWGSRPRYVLVHNFFTEAMQWIKEVELVDSVDELRSSSSTRGISMPNFEVLDARIA